MDIKLHESVKMLPNRWIHVFFLHSSLRSHGDMFVFPHNLPPPFSQNVSGKCHPDGDQMLQLVVLNHPKGKPQKCSHGNGQQCAQRCFLSSIPIIPRKWQSGRDQSQLLAQTWHLLLEKRSQVSLEFKATVPKCSLSPASCDKSRLLW